MADLRPRGPAPTVGVVTSVRIATYNLLHGVPVMATLAQGSAMRATATPMIDPELLSQAAADLAADIVGLQEVDHLQARSHGAEQTATVAEAVGAPWWRFAPAVRGTPGETWHPASPDDDHGTEWGTPGREHAWYGVGLVSRYPVLHSRSLRLRGARTSLPLLVPTPTGNRIMRVPDEPRAAIAAVVQTPRGVMTVATAHLSFVPGVNVAQLRQLRRWLADLPRPVVLVGDFNLPGALPARATGYTSLARVATYPTYRPVVQFDHILSDGLTREHVRSHHALALGVSDHCALAVDLH